MILFVGFVAEDRDTTDLSMTIMDDSNDLNDNTTVGGHVMDNFAKVFSGIQYKIISFSHTFRDRYLRLSHNIKNL